MGLLQWFSGKESACKAGDEDLIPGWGRSPGEGSGNLLQHSCLGNPMDRGAWWAAVHVVTNEWDTSPKDRDFIFVSAAESPGFAGGSESKGSLGPIVVK